MRGIPIRHGGMEDPAPVSLHQIQRQMRRGHAWLRFSGALERQWRSHRFEEVLPQRVALLLAMVLLIALMPLFDALALSPPPELVGRMRAAQFGVMIPACLLALLCLVHPRLQRAAGPALLCAITALCGGVLWLRYLGLAHGYHVPPTLIAAAFAGAVLVMGLRFVVGAVAGLALYAAAAAIELGLQGPTPAAWYELLALGITMLICLIGAWLDEYRSRSAWLEHRLLEQVKQRDPVTGLLHSLAFDEALRRTWSHAQRERRSVALAVFDLDFFRAYNERFGYAAADELLREVGQCVVEHVRRATDLCGRIRGDAFVVLWYGHQRDGAIQDAAQIRRAISALGVLHPDAPGGAGVVTASAGLLWCAPPHPHVSASDLLASAQAVLQLAKRAGRNRMEVRDLESD